jgi:hypothetical protein
MARYFAVGRRDWLVGAIGAPMNEQTDGLIAIVKAVSG